MVRRDLTRFPRSGRTFERLIGATILAVESPRSGCVGSRWFDDRAAGRRRQVPQSVGSGETTFEPGGERDKQQARVLVIVPAYNEQASIGSVIGAVRGHCPSVDLVVVNDGSTDDTAARARACGAKVLDLPINVGIGGAVQCGFQYAVGEGYDLAVQVDGDGQHDPRYVRVLADRLRGAAADMVIGSRFLAEGGFRSTAARRVAIRLLRGLIRVLSGEQVSDPTSGMRAFNQATMELLASYYPQEYPEPECAFMLIWRGYKVTEAPVKMNERRGGRSSIGPLASMLYTVKVAVAISLHMISKRFPPKESSR
jgi:hypothetical protein